MHGATAWLRYSKFMARCRSGATGWPTPVLAIGSGLGAGYLLSILRRMLTSIPAGDPADPGFIKGLTLRINATFIIGAVIMLVVSRSSIAASCERPAFRLS